MSATSVLSPTEFQSRLERYLFERSEEWRAVRVGEKEVSEQAEIVRRFADLFSQEQMDALHEAEASTSGDDRELLYRLRKTCESGLISSQLAEREDELENRLLAERVTFHREEMPLRNAQAKLAVLTSYVDREELGEIQAAASAKFNEDRLDLLRATEELAAEYSGIADPVERNEEEKDISLSELSRALHAEVLTQHKVTVRCATAGSPSCSARGATRCPRATTPPTCGGCRRSSRLTRRIARRKSACRRSTHSAST
jgi:hypothetical protein